MTAKTEHPSFPQPQDARARVWRYLDFAKLVAMLESGALYFARVDQLADPFEGTLSRIEFERWKAVADAAEAGDGRFPAHWKGKAMDYVLATARRVRSEMYVNCWHQSDGESEAMWRLYARSGYAIALESRYDLLVKALPNVEWEQCFVGRITYADHETDAIPEGNAFSPIMHKRRAFAHEHEVRAIIWRPVAPATGERPTGVNVPVKLSELVARIVVAPEAPTWFGETVQALVDRYELSIPVESSKLLAKPYI